jgi:hypothetical protein
MLAASSAVEIVEILPFDSHPAFSLGRSILAFCDFADDVKFIAVEVDAVAACAYIAAKMSRSDIFHGMGSIVENVGTPACSWGNNLIPPRHQILATGISLDGHSPTCVGRGLEPTQLALCASTSAYEIK